MMKLRVPKEWPSPSACLFYSAVSCQWVCLNIAPMKSIQFPVTQPSSNLPYSKWRGGGGEKEINEVSIILCFLLWLSRQSHCIADPFLRHFFHFLWSVFLKKHIVIIVEAFKIMCFIFYILFYFKDNNFVRILNGCRLWIEP